jgi:hypothetical protein
LIQQSDVVRNLTSITDSKAVKLAEEEAILRKTGWVLEEESEPRKRISRTAQNLRADEPAHMTVPSSQIWGWSLRYVVARNIKI